MDHRTQHNAQRNGKLHHGIEPAEIAHSVRLLLLILLLAAMIPACSRETDLSRRTDDYEIVQEGSAPGVTTTLIPPGDSPAMLPTQTGDPSTPPSGTEVTATDSPGPGDPTPSDPGWSEPVTKSPSPGPGAPQPAGTTTATSPPTTTAFPPPLSTQPPSTTRTPPPSPGEEPPEQEEEPPDEEDPPNTRLDEESAMAPFTS